MKRFNQFLRLLLLVVVFTSLTGCVKDAKVIMRWDEKNIYLMADKSCEVDLDVWISAGRTETQTASLSVLLKPNDPRIVKVSDFPIGEYYGEDAKFVQVRVSDPHTRKDGSIWFCLWSLIGIIVILTLGDMAHHADDSFYG